MNNININEINESRDEHQQTMCGCTNKKYLKINAWFSLVEPYFSSYGSYFTDFLYRKVWIISNLQTYRHTDMQTDTDIRLRKIASVDWAE